MTPEEIKTLLSGSPEEVVKRLQEKSIDIRPWADLVKEYDPKNHPVMKESLYPNITQDGKTELVTRITNDMQRSFATSLTQLCVGIPVERIYKPAEDSDKQKEVAGVIEKIMQSNRIDSVNIDRCNMLFASCEVFTFWYAVKVDAGHNLYGLAQPSNLKIKCHNYSPMNGDGLYPLLDEYGDMAAMSFGSKRKVGDKDVEYLDVFTADTHIRYINDGEWRIEGEEGVSVLKDPVGKIPGVYAYRPTPAWEDTSNICYEIEWALSRNGNYLRKNSKPILAIYSDDAAEYGKSGENDSLSIQARSPGSRIEYVTWEQATESLKFYIQQLKQLASAQTHIPDMSFDSMKTTPMSGEARKMMFIDAQLKVKSESGRLLEMFDREINVVKAFVKVIMPGYEEDIDALIVENEITPFAIHSEKEKIENLMTANGGKALMSQRESIERAGYSDDVDKTLEDIASESMTDIGEPSK